MTAQLSENIQNQLDELLTQVEDEFGLRRGFYHSLLGEDDWTFVIKTHALIESAMTQMLTAAVGRHELEDAFANLELSHNKRGKVRFAQNLGLIDDQEGRLIRKFSELRNQLVHNVRNVSFSFDEMLANSDNQQRAAFVDSYGYAARDIVEIGTSKMPGKEFVLANPKFTIWVAAMYLVVTMSLQSSIAKHKALAIAIAVRASKVFGDSLLPGLAVTGSTLAELSRRESEAKSSSDLQKIVKEP
jgi:hypothetical protein